MAVTWRARGLQTALSAALLLAGCARCPDGVACADDVPAACDAAPSTCGLGTLTGVCAGDAAPFVACDETRCLTFEGSCAEGFHPSVCPVDALCCHPAGTESWAFASGEGPGRAQAIDDGHVTYFVREAVQGITEVGELEVVVDPATSIPAPGVVLCTLHACVGSGRPPRTSVVPHADGIALRWDFASLAQNEAVLVEIRLGTEGAPVRAFASVQRTATDVGGRGETPRCEPPDPVTGTLALDRDAIGAAHGLLELAWRDQEIVVAF